MNDRSNVLAAAFTDGALTCGERQLRPLTAGSLLILQRSGNAIFSARAEGAPDPAEDEVQQAMFEFLWIHTAPMKEVVAVAKDREQLRDAALEMALGISLADLEAFGGQFEQLLSQVSLSQVEGIQEGKPGKPAQSLTGLPAWSGTSAGQETASGSDGSSGNSPSYEPSSISTPPSDTTAADADGEPAGTIPGIPLPSFDEHETPGNPE